MPKPAFRWSELEGLAEAAGTQVVGKLTQRRESPDAATYLGKGKVEELNQLAHAEMADVIIFDNASQSRPDAQLWKGDGRESARSFGVDP